MPIIEGNFLFLLPSLDFLSRNLGVAQELVTRGVEVKLALLQQFLSAFPFQQKLCVWCKVCMDFNCLHVWVLVTRLFMEIQKNYSMRAVSTLLSSRAVSSCFSLVIP